MFSIRCFFVILASTALSGCAFFCSDDEDEFPAAQAIDIEPLEAPVIHVRHLPSRNFDTRKSPISLIVLHYTAGGFKESADVLRDNKGTNRVSAHYLVTEKGTIYQLVDESKRAWHAGVSSWKGITDVNSASIGIEMVNLGHDKNGKPRPYPKKQVDAVTKLCLNIQARHDITDVVGHSDVAPGRKIDPGELFPWKTLADCGVKVRTRQK